MKYILITGLVLITLSLQAQKATLEELDLRDGKYYKKGTDELFSGKCEGVKKSANIRYSLEIKDGLAEKEYSETDIETNVKVVSVNYKKGLKSGTATYSYPHGQVKEQGTYTANRRTGKWLEYDPYGKNVKEVNYTVATEWYGKNVKKLEGTLKGTSKEDEWIYFYENGQKQQSVQYENNLKNGVEMQWWENGNKKLLQNWRNDTLDGRYAEWNQDGQIKREGFYKNGVKDGKWIDYNDAGKPIKETEYKTVIKYYPNGNKQEESNFIDGQKNGEFRWWFDNGQEKFLETYENNVANGKWVAWYENGEKMWEGNMVNGKKSGKWNEYYPD